MARQPKWPRWTKLHLAALLTVALATGCREDKAIRETEPAGRARTEARPVHPAPSGPTTAAATTTASIEHSHPPADIAAAEAAAAEQEDVSPRLVFSGKVRLEDGTPARDALVRLVRPDHTSSQAADEVVTETRTASNGAYSFEAAPEPRLYLKAGRPGAASLEHEVRLPGTTAQRSIRRIAVDFTLTSGSVLAGYLVDEKGSPLEGIRLFFTRPIGKDGRLANTGRTLSDAQGRFTFTDVAEGAVTLAVRSEKVLPLTRKVSAPDENLTITLNTGGASISGNVYRLSSRDGIASAAVSLWSGREVPADPTQMPLRELRTDPLGAFVFDHLTPGTYTLSARSQGLRVLPGRTGAAPVVALAANETTEGISLYLYPGHLLEGLVTDRSTSRPLAGVKLQAGSGPDMKSAETGEDGRYRMAGLFADGKGDLRLSAAKNGYMLAESDPGEQSIGLQLTRNKLELEQNLAMIPLIRISGRVRTPQGQGIAGAEVTPMQIGKQKPGRSVASDPEGKYEVLAAPRSTVRLKARAKGCGEGLSASTEARDEDISGLDIILQPGATVSGTVVDERGKGIAGAAVLANFAPSGGAKGAPTHQNQTTGPNGAFTISDVPAREISLIAQRAPYVQSTEERISLSPGETKRNVRLVLRSGHQLAGRVTNEQGQPVRGTTVRADSKLAGENSYGFDKTGADGRFTIRNLSDAPVDVVATMEGYLTARKPGVKPDGGEVNLVLSRAAEVKFTGKVVESSSRKPVDNFTARALPKGDVVKDPAAPGQFTIKGLRQGDRYRVVVEAAGYQPADTGLRQVPADQTEIEETIEVGAGGGIVGRAVLAGTKSPVSGLSVEVRQYSNDLLKQAENVDPVVSGMDGKFRLEGVPPGQAVVVLKRPDPKLEVSRTISVAHSQDADLGDIEIGEGPGLRGRVVRQSGDTPVAGATVILDDKYSNREEQTSTDPQGGFLFQSVRTGEYFVKLPEYRQSLYVTLVEDKIKEVTIRVGEAGLRGTVTRGGQPVRAEVSLSQPGVDVDKSVRTDNEGVFEVTGLTQGYWRVAITPSVSGDQVRVPHVYYTEVPADSTAEKHYELPSGTLRGTVTGPDGTPVSGATVSLFLPGGTKADGSRQAEQRASKTTGADGTFAFEAFPDGEVSVDARKTGVGSARLEGVSIPAEGEAPPLMLKLSGGGTLRSTVLNMTTGNPIPTAWCYLESEGGRLNHGGKRDNTGVMVIRDIPPGRYLVQVSAYNYSVSEHVVDIKAGETESLEDVLYEAGAVNLTVVGNSVKRLGGVSCEITPNDASSIEAPRTGTTDSKGELNWRGLYPGTYTVKVTPPEVAPIIRQVTVQAQQPLYLVLEAK